METENRRLNGWKEIEQFLGMGKDAILAQKYPVRKHKGGKNAAVFAFTVELIKHSLSMPTINEK